MKPNQPKIELVKIGTIKENPGNPRTISKEKFEKLKKSIQEFPEMLRLRPIVVNERNVALGGNMRLKALHALKYKEIPIIRIRNLTKEQQKRFIITDNISYGDWEWEELANSWNVLELQAWGLDLPSFLDKDEAVEDEYEIPEKIKTDIIKGDLFEIGVHRLLCGDSRNADELATLMNSQQIDLYITDPPYGVSYKGKTKDALEIENDSLSQEETHKLWEECFNTTLGCMREGASIYATVPARLLQVGFMQILLAAECLHQCMVWNKGQMVLGHSDYHYQHEPILYGWKPGAKHYFTKDRTQTTVFDVKKPVRNAEHPTMKPIELWSIFINNSSKKKQIVYDSFAGSGTTGIACHQLDRVAYMMEFDPRYVAVILDRMIKLDPSLTIKKNGKPYTNK